VCADGDSDHWGQGMLQKADLREVSFADLQALKDNQVSESHTLDYKRDFPIDREGRLSLAADIVAFANTRGGDLILGVEEQDGFISRFAPVQLADRDEALRSLQSALVDLIEPKVPGVHIEAVGVPDGGYIVIVRTPPSFQAPHRVRKSGVFYTRTSTGNDPMDITTLRSAFLRSETAAEKVRNFRSERIDGLRRRPIPAAPLAEFAMGVLHVVPLASALGGLNVGIPELDPVARVLPPLTHEAGVGTRVNLDGVMSVSATREQTFAYTQLFRDGSIESVMQIQWEHSPVVWVDGVEEALVTEHHEAIKAAHRKLGIDGPAFIMLSFVGIGGAQIEADGTRSSVVMGGVATVPSYYRNLLLPELFVEEFGASSAGIYGSLFDMVWNAAGRQARPKQRR
jgi:Putative DNA-binding domain